jgi:hypothetical protein
LTRARDVVPTTRGEARNSLQKAEEMSSAAATELATGHWNSAGLNAVHAGICAADAALIASAAVRSTSPDHGVVLALLDERVPEFTASQRRQLGGLLKVKNLVAYEQRLLMETEARQLADHANRLTKWAAAIVRDRLHQGFGLVSTDRSDVAQEWRARCSRRNPPRCPPAPHPPYCPGALASGWRPARER